MVTENKRRDKSVKKEWRKPAHDVPTRHIMDETVSEQGVSEESLVSPDSGGNGYVQKGNTGQCEVQHESKAKRKTIK